jgi:(4S)-4-hydroxy-5-phosphonooxypentane-2,3-dione isomerase
MSQREEERMYIASVTVFVKPESVQQFIAASLDNAQNTRKEPNNVRFDVLQCEDDPNRFLLYEVYRAKEDFASHQKTAHYLRWRETVAPWMAQPRQGIKHKNIFPADAGW